MMAGRGYPSPPPFQFESKHQGRCSRMPTFIAACISALLIAAAWRDLATRIIPNWTWIAIVALGLCVRGMQGPTGVALSAAFAFILLIILLPLHAFGLLGGGDVKLAAAVAVGLPPIQVLHFLEYTAFAGGILALLYISGRFIPYDYRYRSKNFLLFRAIRVELRRIKRGGPLPYGVALAAAGILVTMGS